MRAYAERHSLCAQNTSLIKLSTKVLHNLQIKEDVSSVKTVKWDGDPTCNVLLFFPLYDNSSPNNIHKVSRKEINKIKGAMGIDEEPRWYVEC